MELRSVSDRDAEPEPAAIAKEAVRFQIPNWPWDGNNRFESEGREFNAWETPINFER